MESSFRFGRLPVEYGSTNRPGRDCEPVDAAEPMIGKSVRTSCMKDEQFCEQG